MWHLKENTNKSIYKTERDSQTQKIDLWLPKGKGGGVNQEYESKRNKLHKTDKQQRFTVKKNKEI